VSRKITEYFDDINKELKNEEYFNKVIDALDISEELKDQCRQMLKQHVFTEEQFKIYLGSIRQVYNETKEYYEKQSPSEPEFEDPLEQIHHYYQSGHRLSNFPQ
jgi:DNA-directed RNA polymerase subunit N (RpoN/RPB10)